MPNRRLNLRHVFNGGFASDFGPSADVGPDQSGTVVYPFLTEAENVFFELDGGPHKIGGTSKLNATVIESGEEIRGLFDFWQQGTTFSPTQQRIVHAGTKILADAADGIFASIKTGLEDDRVPCYTVFQDELIISSDSTVDVPLVYDGTTVTDLAGTPPPFAFSCVHKNKVWAAGNPALPSRLYYSRTLNANSATSWDTSGVPDTSAGHIDVDPSDGDGIRGIASHKNDLWVLKGPYKGSIHRITGSANSGSDTFNRVPFISGIGAVAHNTLFKFRDDLGFMWADGTIHSLGATAAYGDFNESALSRPLHKFISERVNQTYLHRAWAANDVSRSLVLFALPVDSSSRPNMLLMMDYSRQEVRWAKWTALDAVCVTSVIDATRSNKPVIMIGGSDGYVRKTDTPTRSNDGDAISARVVTPFTSYGSSITMKTIAGVAVGIAPKGAYDATFCWTRDDNQQQTTTFDQAGGDVLGTAAANNFTLNSSALGGSMWVDRYIDLSDGAEFRSISYEIKNTGLNEDLEVHSFTALIERDAESMEN